VRTNQLICIERYGRDFHKWKPYGRFAGAQAPLTSTLCENGIAMYRTAAIVVLGLHLAFIIWVTLGALATRHRPRCAALHVVSLVWALLVEIFPWTCPLTFAENWLEQQAGVAPFEGGFLLHYLDAFVYPNLPPAALEIAAILVLAVNAAIYWSRWSRDTRAGTLS
jgi:hypothetical protein